MLNRENCPAAYRRNLAFVKRVTRKFAKRKLAAGIAARYARFPALVFRRQGIGRVFHSIEKKHRMYQASLPPGQRERHGMASPGARSEVWGSDSLRQIQRLHHAGARSEGAVATPGGPMPIAAGGDRSGRTAGSSTALLETGAGRADHEDYYNVFWRLNSTYAHLMAEERPLSPMQRARTLPALAARAPSAAARGAARDFPGTAGRHGDAAHPSGLSRGGAGPTHAIRYGGAPAIRPGAALATLPSDALAPDPDGAPAIRYGGAPASRPGGAPVPGPGGIRAPDPGSAPAFRPGAPAPDPGSAPAIRYGGALAPRPGGIRAPDPGSASTLRPVGIRTFRPGAPAIRYGAAPASRPGGIRALDPGGATDTGGILAPDPGGAPDHGSAPAPDPGGAPYNGSAPAIRYGTAPTSRPGARAPDSGEPAPSAAPGERRMPTDLVLRQTGAAAENRVGFNQQPIHDAFPPPAQAGTGYPARYGPGALNGDGRDIRSGTGIEESDIRRLSDVIYEEIERKMKREMERRGEFT